MQQQAYSLAKSNKIKHRNYKNSRYYFFEKNCPITEDDIDERMKKNKNFVFRSFDKFLKYHEKMDVVIMQDEMFRSNCTCFFFLKNFICYHIISIAIIDNKFKINPQAKSIDNDLPIKLKRGRRKKITKALIID